MAGASVTTMPTLYVPHGGGPCFFMEWTHGPRDLWVPMGEMLRGLLTLVPRVPSAILVVSAHWEEREPTVLSAEAPPLFYDYHGFPAHTYALRWPAKGSPTLAGRIRSLLADAGIASREDAVRGFDHGVFIPLMLAVPDASIPTVQLSLRDSLDADEHLAIGRALAPLRDDDVLIVGSGMSYHNLRGLGGRSGAEGAARFDDWLRDAVCDADLASRDAKLRAWESAPHAHDCHPRSEHLTPLFVAAGAAGSDRGRRFYGEKLMGAAVSGFVFGG